jgi:O-antigen ligase
MTNDKIERAIFYLLIFSIPLWTRKFFYSVGAVEGFNEWQSVFLHGTDLLIASLFIFWAFNKLKRFKTFNFRLSIFKKFKISNFPQYRSKSLHTAQRFSHLRKIFHGETISKLRIEHHLLLIVLVFSFFSIFLAPYWQIGLYRFIKLLMFVWLFWYVATQKFKFRDFALPLSAGAVLQALIAIGQFLKQSSLGLRLLGEPYLVAGGEGVAEMVAFGARFMRAYGTFGHPNVLAAFLALAIFVLIAWYLTEKRLQKGRNFIFVAVALILLGLGLLFTFSRSVLAIFVLLIILYFIAIFVFKNLRAFRPPAKKIAIPAGIAALVFGLIYFPEIYERFITNIFHMRDLAVVERRFLFYTALEFVSHNPTGVGLGNFTLYFREVFWGLRESLYQPVHNIYLLAMAEIGVLGGMAFSMFLLKLLWQSIKEFLARKKNILCLSSVFSILFIILTGMSDHYYWTLQQGALIFWITAGLAVKIYGKNRFA